MPVIQWFPGHMAKTKRMLQENAPLVDVVLEIVDARCPLASSNAELLSLVENKPRIIILNKADVAESACTRAWTEYYRGLGMLAVPLDAVKGTGVREVLGAIREAFAPRLVEWTAKGRKPRPARVMAVGIPNVGKSSAINRVAGARRAHVGDKPGVTRGKQWVRIGSDIELLDMPGVLVPKFEDPYDGVLLAAVGAVKDEIYDKREVVVSLLPLFWERAQEALTRRLGLEELLPEPHANIEVIGRHRGLLGSGGIVEEEKTAALVLKEFREGRLGRISLQRPPEPPSSDT